MADLTTTQELQPWPTGVLVTSGDMANLQTNIDNATGLLLRALGGTNFLPNVNPLGVVASGGMVVTVGGPSQWVIAQGRPIDVCPAQSFTVPNGGASARTDLIAIQATRIGGSQTTSRYELGSNPPTGSVAQPVTLVAGAATLTFGAPFTATPMVLLRPRTPDANAVTVTVAFTTSGGNTTGMTITSPDATDARTFDVLVTGPQVGQLGSPATITLLENRPAFKYVQGTTTATPQPPAGYDAFATISVPANATTITQGEIAILFPEFASPVLDAAFRNLTATSSFTCDGGVFISANASAASAQSPHVSSNGVILYAFDWTGSASVQTFGLIQVASDGTTQTFSFGGKNALANLNAAVANLLGLNVSGNATIAGNFRTIGSGEFDNGLLVSGPTGLSVTNNLSVAGQASVSGMTVTGIANLKETHFTGGVFIDGGNGLVMSGGPIVNAGAISAASGTMGTLSSDQNGATATKTLTVNGITYLVATHVNGGLFVDGGNGLVMSGGPIVGAGKISSSDITTSRGDGTGALFVGDPSHYLYWDKTNYQLPGGNLLINGAYAVTGITSPDSSVTIAEPTPGQVTITATVPNHSYGGATVTGADGSVGVQVPYQIIGAAANYSANTNDNRAFMCQVDQQRSNFAAGYVVFKAVDGTKAVNGIGIYFNIVTANTPHL